MDGSLQFKKNPFPKFEERLGGIRTKVHRNIYKYSKRLPIPYKMEGLAGKL